MTKFSSINKIYQRPMTGGFTLIELMIVIVVMGILTAVVAFGIGDWRTRTATDEVKASLVSASTALQSEANFKGAYSTTLPDSFTASDTVETTVKTASASGYCIEATSKIRTAVIFHIESTDKTAMVGPC